MALQGSLAQRARLLPSSLQLAEAEGDDKVQRRCHRIDWGRRHIAVVVAVRRCRVGVVAMLEALVLAPFVIAGPMAAPIASVGKGGGGGTQGEHSRAGGEHRAKGGDF